jgi:PilZ domain
MDSTFGSDKKANLATSGTPARGSSWERRSSRRCKITQLMLIRPSDPEREPFEDIRSTLSVSQTGVYFRSSEAKYEVGMRLFVSLPYSNNPADMTHEYLTEVVRRDSLSNGLVGIGLKILMERSHQEK